MHIIGTAGHVDHGKSSLVLALTGRNPDRLVEEQRRGMTLDLGFAPLRFPDGVEAGIIDVPGHERFLHNMLAGAAGMELLLLVIDASEGPRPQTFEHLRILDFLNVSRAIVVLTKIDLVSPERRPEAVQEARDATKGTIAQDAPVVQVSTVTGEGLSSLASAIHDALVTLPPRRPKAPAYLPVDRAFALPGHGTIVTGTLMQGSIAVGDTLALQPSGTRVRLKSLQIFGANVRQASGGSRVAVNLPGIDVTQVARGEALVAAREFHPARELVIEFTPLLAALGVLRRRTPVRVHIGSAEIPGDLRFAEAPPLTVGATRSRLVLWRPAVFYPGQRIIVRRMSPKDLLGGGVVVGVASPREPVAIADTAAAAGELDDAPEGADEVLVALRASALAPLSLAQLAGRANLTAATVETSLAWLLEHGRAARLHKPVEYLSRESLDAAFARVDSLARRRHASCPWRLGITSDEAALELDLPPALAQRLLAVWVEDGRLAMRAGHWHAPDFTPALTKAQRAFFERAVTTSQSAPFAPQSFARIEREMAHEPGDVAEALESLLATGAFVRVGDDLYRRSQIEGAQAAIAAHLERHGSATMAQLRDVLGTSRKYALPLMEHFDSVGFTLRDGDLRRLRKVR